MDNAICHNESYTYSPVNGEDGVIPVGTTYSWQAPTSTSGNVSGISGSGDSFSTGTISNITSTSATLTYTVTPTVTSTGCEGEHFTVTITVNPEPQIDNFTETICEGDTFTSITPEDVTNGVVPIRYYIYLGYCSKLIIIYFGSFSKYCCFINDPWF